MVQEVEKVNTIGPVEAVLTVTNHVKSADGSEQTSMQHLTYHKVEDEVSYDDAGIHVIEFKLPLVQGATWETAGMKVTTFGPETIDLPYQAGLTAVKIMGKMDNGLTAANWYADGIGLVRLETADSSGRKLIHELKSFTAPSGKVY